jgi:hypothetical protein
MSFSISSLSFIFFFHFAGWGFICPGGMLAFPRGGCGSTLCGLSAHLLVCVFQAGLELAVSEGMEAFLFSQCNVVWRSSVRAGVWGVQVLLILGVFFFLPSVAPVSQQDSRLIELTLSATSL